MPDNQPEAQRQSHIFASLEYLREILDSCPYLAVVLNEQREIVFFNRALLSLAEAGVDRGLFGLRLGDAMQCSHASEGEGCGFNEACQTCGAFLAVGEGLQSRHSTRECRFTRNVEGKMEALDLLITVSPAIVRGERFVVCSMRDISHEKRREALERIFFHDILNTATGVELLAGLLKGMVQGDASESARQISACANQMVEEIQSQQQLLAAEKDELAVRAVEFTTARFLGALVERYRVHTLARNRVIRIATDSQDVAICTDDSILRRVLQNMLKNALEASRKGETITAGCRDAGEEVEFWVHNPEAMPEPVRLQVFQRSFSTKGLGRGLGTYSMRLLSERYLKGLVTFHSTAAEGTVFQARYPKRIQ